MKRDDKFDDGVFILSVYPQTWEMEDVGELPKGKLPRKLKKKLKKALDNPDRKRVYKANFKYADITL